MKLQLIFWVATIFVPTLAVADDHNPFKDEGHLEWIQVRHFIDGEEIPGAPKAILDGKGWVIVMPNYWNGFVFIPNCEDSKVQHKMAGLKRINWWSQFLPLITPNHESDYRPEAGYPTPQGKRGLVPGGELFYANRVTKFIPSKEYSKQCAALGMSF